MNNNDMNVVGNGVVPDNGQYFNNGVVGGEYVAPNQMAMYQGMDMSGYQNTVPASNTMVYPTDMSQTQAIPVQPDMVGYQNTVPASNTVAYPTDMSQPQTIPVQADMSVYQNTVPASNTMAYPTDMSQTQAIPVQADMSVYQNTVPASSTMTYPTDMSQTQAIPVQPDMGVYQNTAMPMPVPGIPQVDMGNYNTTLPQPMVTSPTGVPVQNTMANMQQVQPMVQPNNFAQPMPNAYPALGSVNGVVPNQNPANVLQNNFQTGVGAYQNTGATQVGRVNTYQTVTNNKKSDKNVYKKGFNWRGLILVLVALAAVAGLYLLYTSGYFDAYINK